MLVRRIATLIHNRIRYRSCSVRIHWTAYVDVGSELAGLNSIAQYTKVEQSTIGFATYLAAQSHVVRADVGGYCSIGPTVRLGGLDKHPTGYLGTSPIFYSAANPVGISLNVTGYNERPRTTIGGDVWIGCGALVLSGVNIAPGSIIAAGAVVTKDTEPYGIYGGVPARLLRRRFDDATVDKLLQSAWWNFDLQTLKGWLRLFDGGNVIEDPAHAFLRAATLGAKRA